MIVANHLGENLIPTLVAGGTAAAPLLLVLLRARLSRLGGALCRAASSRAAARATPDTGRDHGAA
jgi:hypothetical protein